MNKKNYRCEWCGCDHGDKTYVGDGSNWFHTCKRCYREQPVDWREIMEQIKENTDKNTD